MIAGGRRPWSAGSLLGLAGVLHVLLPTPLAMVLALLHPQRMRKLAFGVCLLLASCHAALEPAVVAELSACPTGNQLFSSGIDLETMLDAWLNDTLAFNRTTCTLAFQNLTLCSTDKGSNSTGSNTTSLRVRQECCSAACAVGVEQALITSGPGCFRAFTGAVCDSQHNSSLAEPLFGLAQRCLGVNASCTALAEPGSLLPPELQARSQLGVVPLDPMLDLVPDQPPADSLLATVEEIGQVASQGGGGRRMLARRQEVVGSGR